MKYLFRKHAILLAALLQVLPVMRTFVANPTSTNSFAIILRWTIGSTAALGAYDAFSASSIPYFLPLQTNIVMTVGQFYTNNIIVTNTGTDSGAFFELTNSAKLDSGQIGGGRTTTVCLPTGITLKCFDSVSSSHQWFYAALYGTPVVASAISKVNVDAGFSGAGDIYTNLYFTVVGGSSPPNITNQPVSFTNVAGGNASFNVLAGGAAPLAYQWRLNTFTLSGATNTSLTLNNIRLSQAGDYNVVITNSAGSITSSIAHLEITLPPSPSLDILPPQGNIFLFTFTPIVGLTNTVETNSVLTGGSWGPLTNIPPPASSSSVTVTDVINDVSRFYRVKLEP